MRWGRSLILLTIVCAASPAYAQSALSFRAAGGLGGADIGYHATLSTELSVCAAFDVSWKLSNRCAAIASAVPMTVFAMGSSMIPEEHHAPTASAQAYVAGIEIAEEGGHQHSFVTVEVGFGRCETNQADIVRTRSGPAIDVSVGVRSADTGLMFAVRSTNVFTPTLSAHGVMLMLGVTLRD